jgi:hypothetical protein
MLMKKIGTNISDLRQIADERQEGGRGFRGVAVNGVTEHRPPEHVPRRRPEQQTGEDFPENGRLTDPEPPALLRFLPQR